MTLETCKKKLELAVTDAEKKFWKDRIDRKIAKYPNYAHLRVVEKPVEVKKFGKKSKR